MLITSRWTAKSGKYHGIQYQNPKTGKVIKVELDDVSQLLLAHENYMALREQTRR